ncbi:hypothetical protein SBI_05755 [Streptomyces bingchenggensis BCW-1]|uniref:Uncharacterized protein n=1 Tax=Streptomyces bingchenggensis (strain BCW-1) TaxID=749414 RepID=D7CEH9_STRBB|nr:MULTISPECIES: hypothetical protein [Streptomyces]ADI08875.1 hypothetical protein SBI_05755 [Streptomyces bingchenggensis BCW-1]
MRSAVMAPLRVSARRHTSRLGTGSSVRGAGQGLLPGAGEERRAGDDEGNIVEMYIQHEGYVD